ncbi:esterase-like activity of phytase family protein [Albidovulum aquaemixtae]|uniref:esterase-like activity of phytase family protein n=1 Tax=Albidovulum aquaemixtae TaxID=1542388 RepID=UPI0015E80A3A|nr:esterase-like activity of phytase family protein [Defluviimonas aquaemixtae]
MPLARLAALALALGAGAGSAEAAELLPRGVFRWEGEGLSGLSGLWVAPGGGSLLAVSDRGLMLSARIERDGDGRIRAVATDWQAQMLDNSGREVAEFTADAEALAVAPDGTAYVGFESYTRITALKPPDMTPTTLHHWERFRALWGNEGIEGLALGADGRLLAVLEGQSDGVRQTFVQENGDWVEGPSLPAHPDWALSDAAFGPDGWLYLLERRHAWIAGFATRLSRVMLDADGAGPPEVLLKTGFGELDNMEGMSLWRDGEGHVFVTLVSDDNFLPVQNTILAEFELRE